MGWPFPDIFFPPFLQTYSCSDVLNLPIEWTRVKILGIPPSICLSGFSSFLTLMKVKVLVTQLCPILCDTMECSPPGSSVHGILQARILEWVVIPFSRRSSQPRDWTWVSCIAGKFFTIWATIAPIGAEGWGKWGDADQIEQISSYKMN